MPRLVFGATLLFALVIVCPPLPAQVSHIRRESAEGVTLSVCNAGKVDIDVLVAKASPVVTTHIVPNTCAPAYSDSAGAPAFVGFALIDSRGQWGPSRRLGLLPDLGLGDFSMGDILPALGLGGSSTRSRVLDSAARDVSVRRGNQDVPAQLQLSFRPMHAGCERVQPSHAAVNSLPANATAIQRSQAEIHDAETSRRIGVGKTVCDSFVYTLNAVAYPETREINFVKDCARCPSNESHEEQAEAQPQLMNWNDLHRALAKLPYSGGLGEVPRNLIIRGTVSRVELALPGASVPWVNVYFRESAEQRTNLQGQTHYGAFNVCSSNPDIFKDLFGADFRASMIGKALEVEGQFQRASCDGWEGSIRLTLARQMRVIGPALIDSPGPRPISAAPPEAPGAIGSNPRPPASVAPPAQPVSKGAAAAPAATIAPPAAAPATAPPATAPAQAAAPAAPAPDPAAAAAARAKALQDQQDRTAQRRADAQQQRQQQMAEHEKQVQERAEKIAACRQQAAKDHPGGGADVVKAFTSCVQALQAR